MRLKLVIGFAALAAGLLAWAVPGSGNPRIAGAGPPKVSVQDNFFDRRSIEITPGGKVVWVWKGENRHNVRFTKVPKGAQRGGSKTKTQGKWRRIFKVEGTYRYVCKLYTGMRGTITVKTQQPTPSKSAVILESQQGK